ncbi:MAG: hypothetical protein AAF368_03255, partial [Planctomycetota bacterium]
ADFRTIRPVMQSPPSSRSSACRFLSGRSALVLLLVLSVLPAAGCKPEAPATPDGGTGTDGPGALPGSTPSTFTSWYDEETKTQKQAEGQKQYGKRTGLWTYWFEDGSKQGEGTFASGERDGRWTAWHPNGQKHTEAIFEAGVLSGGNREWYENGQLAYEVQFEGGEQNGPGLRFHPDGSKAASESWEKGKRVGTWTEWYPNGQKASEAKYVEGLRQGVARSWFESGQLASEGEYVDDLAEGPIVKYWEDGSVHQRGEMSKDKLIGTSIRTFPTGVLQAKISFDEDGNAHGRTCEWHPNGQVAVTGEIEHGKRIGLWYFFTVSGAILTEESGLYEGETKTAELTSADIEAFDPTVCDATIPE